MTELFDAEMPRPRVAEWRPVINPDTERTELHYIVDSIVVGRIVLKGETGVKSVELSDDYGQEVGILRRNGKPFHEIVDAQAAIEMLGRTTELQY